MEAMKTNNHFKNAIMEIREYLENNEEIPDVLFERFVNELKMSNLILPAVYDGELFTYQTLESDENGDVLLPVFTDIEEYEKHETNEDLCPIPLEFEEYMELIEDDNIDLILVNMEGDSMPLGREFLLDIDYEVENVNEPEKPYTGEELRDIFNEISNPELIEYLKSEEYLDLEKLYVELSNSRLINPLISETSRDDEAKDGIIEIDDDEGFSLAVIEDMNKNTFLTLFTDKKAMEKTEMIPELHYYGQISVLSAMFDFVLKNDLDGVVINMNSDDFLIPREAILHQASGIEIIAEDSRFFDAANYAFLL